MSVGSRLSNTRTVSDLLFRSISSDDLSSSSPYFAIEVRIVPSNVDAEGIKRQDPKAYRVDQVKTFL